jgi:acetyl esterase/lipase
VTGAETTAGGRAFDPELSGALAAFPVPVDMGAGLSDPNVVAMLRSTTGLLEVTGGTIPTDDRVELSDHRIAGGPGHDTLRVRVYRPRGGRDHQRGADSALAAVVFFHGGAFIIGDPETEEGRCLRYAGDGGFLVVSVDYRLAPEHPFPAGVDDCYAALEWTAGHAIDLGIDAGRLAVAGSSAGGGLAAAVALMARDRGGPALRAQILNYPVLDDTMTTRSMADFTDTPLWTRGASESMWRQYLAAGEGTVSPYAAPARAESLHGLPPAYVMTCEFDPLRDEGIAYAQRLLLAGVSTELHQFAGTFHGFDLVAPGAALSRRSVDDQIAALTRALGRP